MIPDLQQHFSKLRTCADHNIDLAAEALKFASCEYPEIDVRQYMQRLDDFADDIRAENCGKLSTQETVSVLNDYLFEIQGFKGNLVDFNDPRNSYLNQVLDRKLGIPISLSLIYVEVGRRLGLDIHGVSFPGHFLVRLNRENDFVILDPFSRGISLDNKELTGRLSHFPQFSSLSWTLDDHLVAASACDFLSRMLRNLKVIFRQMHDYDRALNIVSLILALNPESAVDYFDRAEIFEQLECFTAACSDLEKYLVLRPDLAQPGEITERIHILSEGVQQLH